MRTFDRRGLLAVVTLVALVAPFAGCSSKDNPATSAPTDGASIGIDSMGFSAYFWRGPGDTRTKRAFGSECVLYTAPPTTDAGAEDPPLTPTGPAPNAAAIHVQVGGATFTASPDPSTGRYAGSKFDPPLSPGDAVKIHADGATTPPFDLSVVMPSPVNVTTPTPSSTIDVHAPLAVAWTGTSAGTFRVVLATASPTTLVCLFDASAGKGQIPSEALAQMPAGSVALAFDTNTHSSTVAGTFAVEANAFAYASIEGTKALQLLLTIP